MILLIFKTYQIYTNQMMEQKTPQKFELWKTL